MYPVEQCPDQVHWPAQPHPTMQHLLLIQRQRDLDKDKAAAVPGAARADLEDRQCAINEDFREMQRADALRGPDAEDSARGQGKDRKRIFGVCSFVNITERLMKQCSTERR